MIVVRECPTCAGVGGSADALCGTCGGVGCLVGQGDCTECKGTGKIGIRECPICRGVGVKGLTAFAEAPKSITVGEFRYLWRHVPFEAGVPPQPDVATHRIEYDKPRMELILHSEAGQMPALTRAVNEMAAIRPFAIGVFAGLLQHAARVRERGGESLFRWLVDASDDAELLFEPDGVWLYDGELAVRLLPAR